MPARLIDVGGSDDNAIRLVDSFPQLRTYITLSHCWGDADALAGCSLTAARLDNYRQRIPKDVLPATFLHACQFARSLGQRHVWIDSLCIVQDSPADWAAQSAQMWRIYSSAWLNLSATASQAPADGLFRERGDKALGLCIIHVEEGHPALPAGQYRLYADTEWKLGVDDGPVNARAWVLQERLLAPRVLHFGEREVFWECRKLKAPEEEESDEEESDGEESDEEEDEGKNDKENVEEGADDVENGNEEGQDESKATVKDGGKGQDEGELDAWSAIVERYSEAKLSYPSDKLVALSALAEQVALAYPSSGRYLAGLWEAPLISQLPWKMRCHNNARAAHYRAPSWSWACMDGPV
ncbi:heterokaryon incompatibility protein-domain-containing protein, partial [Lasiosphaeria ovina]